MKTKFTKILGVALTTVLLASLMMFVVPTPVSANPGNVAWENVPVPGIGPCRTLGVVGGGATVLGPLEQNSDGTILYAYDSSGTATVLFKSVDGGRCWTPTNYTAGGALVAIVCPTGQPNTVYVTNGLGVYKSVDAGTTFIQVTTQPAVFDPIGAVFEPAAITSMDVAPLSVGRNIIIVGTAEGVSGNNNADVFTLDELGTFPPVWVNMDFNAQMAAFYGPAIGAELVPAVAFTPDTSATLTMVAIGFDATAETAYISMKVAGAFWGGNYGNPVGTLAASSAAGSAAIAFPVGFSLSASPFFYFGISDSAAVAAEGVYSFWGQPWPVNSFITANNVLATNDVVSLACGGEFGVGAVLAGLQNGTLLRSLDGGATWGPPIAKPPAGAANAYVQIVGTNWLALISGANGGLSLSVDNGTSWNGISFVLNTIANIADLAFLADGTLFMATDGLSGAGVPTNDIWRFSAGAWERVFTSTTNLINLVEAVPGSTTTVFAAKFGVGAQAILRSTNAGQIWAAQSVNCPLAGTTLSAWVIISDLKQVVGAANGNVFITNYNGISWGAPVATGLAGAVYSMALDPTNPTRILAGGPAGNVALSTNGGLAWPNVWAGGAGGTGLNAASNTYVSFDASNPAIMYATDVTLAAPGMVRKLSPAPTDLWAQIDGQGQDMDTGVFGLEFPIGNAAGIASSPTGSLYATDSRAVVVSSAAANAAGAMFRCLDPQAPIVAPINQPYWEQAAEAIPGPVLVAQVFGVRSGTSNLWLIPGTVPTLWAIDTVAPGLWTYTDTLAVANTLGTGDPATTTVTQAWDVTTNTVTATISWSALLGATGYQVQANSRADWNPATFVTAANTINFFPDTQAQFINLVANTTYSVRVRAATQAVVGATPAGIGAPVRSPWSNIVTFITQLGQATPPPPLVPLPGATGVSINTPFDWDAVLGATSYHIVVATDEDLTMEVASDDPTTDYWQIPVTLEYDTTYYWSVSAVGAGPDSLPIFSVFRTEVGPAAAVYTCGYCGLQFSSQAALEAHITAVHAAAEAATPVYIWVVIGIGAVLVIAVVVLIARTRGAA